MAGTGIPGRKRIVLVSILFVLACGIISRATLSSTYVFSVSENQGVEPPGPPLEELYYELTLPGLPEYRVAVARFILDRTKRREEASGTQGVSVIEQLVEGQRQRDGVDAKALMGIARNALGRLAGAAAAAFLRDAFSAAGARELAQPRLVRAFGASGIPCEVSWTVVEIRGSAAKGLAECGDAEGMEDVAAEYERLMKERVVDPRYYRPYHEIADSLTERERKRDALLMDLAEAMGKNDFFAENGRDALTGNPERDAALLWPYCATYDVPKQDP